MNRLRVAVDGILVLLVGTWIGWIMFGVPPAQDPAGAWAQKIFYLHVPSALTTYLGVLLLAFAGAATLLRDDRFWDRAVQSVAEVTFVFSTLVLLTGPFWARPVWGVWWRWEPRLTTFLILWLMLGAFFLLRASIPHGRQQRIHGAIYGLLVVVNVPIVHFSVNLWQPEQQLHPMAIELAPVMHYTLYGSMVMVGVLFVRILWLRYTFEHQRRERVQSRYDQR